MGKVYETESLSAIEDDEALVIWAKNQEWTKKALKELKLQYNIFFMTNGDGVHPVMVFKQKYKIGNREGTEIQCAIGSEDDGTIRFKKQTPSYFENTFSIYWINSLISDLIAAQKFAKEHEKKLRVQEEPWKHLK